MCFLCLFLLEIYKYIVYLYNFKLAILLFIICKEVTFTSERCKKDTKPASVIKFLVNSVMLLIELSATFGSSGIWQRVVML